MTSEEAIEIIRDRLPKRPYVPYRAVCRRVGKGFTHDLVDLSIEEEASEWQGMSIDGHVLTQEELIAHVAAQRARHKAEFDRIHEAFDMLCEAVSA